VKDYNLHSYKAYFILSVPRYWTQGDKFYDSMMKLTGYY